MTSVAIVGAGPYGLSIAAHFRSRGIPFRVFGKAMDSWLAHMPKGMFLKSDGFASNIYDPGARFTLGHFCAQRGIKYADMGIPVSLDTFTAYGLAFKDRMVPELEDKTVTAINRVPAGFSVSLDDSETFEARQVVLAVGITHFEFVPSSLASLPPEFLSHSARHSDLGGLRNRRVAVIGGGASALDLAGLLHEAGAQVQLISRRRELKFHNAPNDKPRSWWQQIQRPQSGLGPGWRSRFYSDAPWAFYYLPQNVRLEIVRKALGPSGGWFIKDKVIGKVPLLLGYTPEAAEVQNGEVKLYLRAENGEKREVLTDHVIAATGYKVDLERLTFLSPEMRSQLKTVNGAPVLSSSFESSIPGLYFAGVAAANSFGPLMRFAFGAGFAARTLTRAVTKANAHASARVPIASAASTAK